MRSRSIRPQAFGLACAGALLAAGCGGGSDDTGLVAACGNGLIETGLVCFEATGTDFGAAPLPARIVKGNFNADALPDLAVSTIGAPSSNTTVLLNLGSGNFSSANLGAIPSAGTGIAVGTFNGDTALDIARGTGSGGATIFLGSGAGTFITGSTFVGPAVSISQVAAARLDADTDTDLILIGGAQLISAVNDGLGNFTPTPFAAAGTLSGLSVGDFNGDGFTDALVLETGAITENLRVALCNGLGGLAAPTTLVLPFTAAGPTAVGDLDGDTDLDAVAVGQFSNQAVVLRGNGTGTFTPGTPFATGTDPQGAVLADFDRDGRLDLAISLFSGAAVEIRLGDGTGGFGAATTVSLAGDRPNDVLAADLDDDLAPDLALPLGATDEVRIFAATP